MKGRAGIRWDSVVYKVWKGIGGSQEEILSMEKFGGYKTGSTRKARKKGMASAKKQDE